MLESHHFFRAGASVRNIAILLASLLWLHLAAVSVFSLGRPEPGEIERYRQDGSLARRLEFVRRLGNDRVRPDLVQRKLAQIQALQQGQVFVPETFPYSTGLPSVGSPKIFALLIDFPDIPHTQSQSLIQNKIFGNGNASEYPYESLRNYYSRASYGQLNMQGTVLPWYRAQYNRDHYGSDAGVIELIKEALSFQTTTQDFSQYDNNGDGKIDYFCVFYSGPQTGWGSIWWYWCDLGGGLFAADSFTVDGKKIGVFSFQWESNPPGAEYSPHPVMHETGHGLGLPDLYDYDTTQGVPGGVGGLDMMDGNWGDHNGFSKWLLDWLTPTVVGNSGVVYNLTLRPTAQYPDCVVIMPNMMLSKIFSECFVVQNRSRCYNDSDIPSNGLLIWHVDATLNSGNNNFQYDNSYTAHKFMRLMEADGMEHIEQGYSADGWDFYVAGKEFTPVSKPNSNRYNSSRSGVHVQNISGVASALTASLLIDNITLSDAVDTTTLVWTTGGNSIWFGETASDAYGLDDARSGPIGHNQNTWIQTVVAEQETIRFDWKVSSEANHDFLEFYIDDTFMARIGGSLSWQSVNYLISTSGQHTLKWRYIKDGSGSAGLDRGWLDNVGFAPSIPLAEALDSTLTWTAGGNAGWYGQSALSYFGGDAARSAPVLNNQYAGLQTTLPAPGTLNFYWKVSSEQNYDFLEFYVDGVLRDRISGAVDWQLKSYYIPTPGAIVRWRYVKDASISKGSDCGWLDKVEFFPNPALAEATDNTFPAWMTWGDGLWYWQSSTYLWGGDAARSGSIADGKNSVIHLSTPSAGNLSFWWKVSSQQDHDYLEVHVDGVLKDRISGSVDWQQKSYLVQNGSQIDWKYVKDGSASNGEDCGWLDKVEITDSQIAEAVDNTMLAWMTGGSLPWFRETTTYNSGGDAAESGHISNSQNTWVSTQVTGPGILRFYWKVSSEPYSDSLEFDADGVKQDQISGEVNWQQKTYNLGPGTHALTWKYSKDAGFSQGSDRGWLDKVEWTPTISIGEAVDKPDLVWTTYGPAGWYGQATTYFYGLDAARTGAITDNQTSFLETTYNGAGTLRFYWKVSSEPNDHLEFYIDNTFKAEISGVVDWQQKAYVLNTGAHTLRWEYVKDGSLSSRADCGYLDKVEIIANPTLAQAVDNTSFTWTTSGNANWLGQTLTSYYDGDAAQSGTIAKDQASIIQTTVTGPGILRFFWKVSSTAGWNPLEFWIDNTERCAISGNVDWEQRGFVISPGSHTLRWRYAKTTVFVDGLDCGWLDKVEYQPGVAPSCTIRVPQDYSTIQAAIDAALDGCSIVVSPGRYKENINLRDKNIVLRSTNPTDPSVVAGTILDGNHAGPVVTFGGWEGPSCVLAGFTITNGHSDWGAGIFGARTHATHATIQNNRIIGNMADANGGGIVYCNGVIQNNIIARNTAQVGAGVSWSSGTLQNNTIYGNAASMYGGGLFAVRGKIRNNILWQNTATTDTQVCYSDLPQYCCIQSWTGGGTGNISSDPLFYDRVHDDFHLTPNSSCVDAGCAVAGLTKDLEGNARPHNGTSKPRGDGSDFDIGTYEYYYHATGSEHWWLFR